MKLQGDEYRKYWRDRMAKGPSQAGFWDMTEAATQAQGFTIFHAFRRAFHALGITSPSVIAELGCGWGRMLALVGDHFSHATLYGTDLCPEAVKHCQDTLDPFRFCFSVGDRLPDKLHGSCDLVYTSTCLQHITDDQVFTEARVSMLQALAPGGHVLAFENVDPKTASARHLRGHGAEDYFGPGSRVLEEVVLRGERHAMIAVGGS